MYLRVMINGYGYQPIGFGTGSGSSLIKRFRVQELLNWRVPYPLPSLDNKVSSNPMDAFNKLEK